MFASNYEKVPSDAETESTPLAGGTAKQQSTRTARALLRVQILLVCTLYAIVGPTLVLVNNRILKTLDFPFPLFLSAFGLVTTSCICFIIVRVLPWLRRRLLRQGSATTNTESALTTGSSITFNFWLRNMIPIGAAQGVTFASTNAAYMYLSITFTQVRRWRPRPCGRSAARTNQSTRIKGGLGRLLTRLTGLVAPSLLYYADARGVHPDRNACAAVLVRGRNTDTEGKCSSGAHQRGLSPLVVRRGAFPSCWRRVSHARDLFRGHAPRPHPAPSQES
jgi:hypothetical protein